MWKWKVWDPLNSCTHVTNCRSVVCQLKQNPRLQTINTLPKWPITVPILVLTLWQCFIHVLLILPCFCTWDILWKKCVLRKQSLPSIPYKKDTIVMLPSCVCALEEHGRKTLDWPPNTLLLSQVWPRKWVSMSMCLSSCTHKADKASHLVLDLRAERVNFAKEPAKSLTQPWCGHRDLSRWFPLFSPRSNAPDSETVLLCKTDGQRWYLDCLVSGTERQNYPVRGKVILENPHSVCWRKISADKCSLRAFYPNVGVSLVILMWSHYREKGHRTMRRHFDVCCIGGPRVYLGRWGSTLSL